MSIKRGFLTSGENTVEAWGYKHNQRKTNSLSAAECNRGAVRTPTMLSADTNANCTRKQNKIFEIVSNNRKVMLQNILTIPTMVL